MVSPRLVVGGKEPGEQPGVLERAVDLDLPEVEDARDTGDGGRAIAHGAIHGELDGLLVQRVFEATEHRNRVAGAKELQVESHLRARGGQTPPGELRARGEQRTGVQGARLPVLREAPENVAIDWMCADIMWSDGEGMAQILELIGARPWRKLT